MSSPDKTIAKLLLADAGSRIKRYFDSKRAGLLGQVGSKRNVEGWITEYSNKSSSKSFVHDEPWLTLVALYGLLGDQSDLTDSCRESAVADVLRKAFPRDGAGPDLKQLTGANVEVYLPELIRYRTYLAEGVFEGERGPYHPYHDRKKALTAKLANIAPRSSGKPERKSSFEGNTNLDALISGIGHDDRPKQVFIEAKFLSDISKDITYVTVRNQIARNIDAALSLMTNDGANLEGIDDLWFVLLTPGIFRTEAYGGHVKSPLDPFQPDKGRLYCYKMDDYLEPALLAADLPHWEGTLEEEHWETVCSHVGWLTFEDINEVVLSRGTGLLGEEELAAYERFMRDRELWG